MNRQTKTILLIAASVLLLFSCGDQSNTTKNSLLEQATELAVSQPDSAVVLLDSIHEPEKMPEEEYMRYLVTRVQARYNAGHNVSQESAIFEACDYFEKQNKDFRQIALAHQYSACVYREQNLPEDALKSYLKAADYARLAGDKFMEANILRYTGYAYYEKILPQKALEAYKKSYAIFSELPGEENRMIDVMTRMANTYTMANKQDTALIIQNKALKLADRHNNYEQQVRLLNDIGLAHWSSGNHKEARKFILKSIALNNEDYYNDPVSKTKSYINLCYSYRATNQIDSLEYYFRLAEEDIKEENNEHVSRYIFQQLSTIKEQLGEYDEALDYYKKYMESTTEILSRERMNAMLEVEKIYNMSKKEKELMDARLESQIYFSATMGAIALLALSLFLGGQIYRRHRKVKEKNIALDKQVGDMVFIHELYKNIITKSTAFEKNLEQLSQNYSAKEKSKGYEIINDLVKSMKKDTQASMHKMAEDFLGKNVLSEDALAALTTSDLFYISLSYCKYPAKDIAAVMGVNTHALLMRKQRLIKKLEKAGAPKDKINQLPLNN